MPIVALSWGHISRLHHLIQSYGDVFGVPQPSKPFQGFFFTSCLSPWKCCNCSKWCQRADMSDSLSILPALKLKGHYWRQTLNLVCSCQPARMFLSPPPLCFCFGRNWTHFWGQESEHLNGPLYIRRCEMVKVFMLSVAETRQNRGMPLAWPLTLRPVVNVPPSQNCRQYHVTSLLWKSSKRHLKMRLMTWGTRLFVVLIFLLAFHQLSKKYHCLCNMEKISQLGQGVWTWTGQTFAFTVELFR